MHREDINKLISDIFRLKLWNHDTLAEEIGVTQSVVSRWLSGKGTPRPSHLSRLREIHAEAIAHKRASRQFFPLIAMAESYPSELHDLATQALDEMLDFGSLIAPLNVRGDNFSIDLHIRPAKLPKYVSAYTFANNLRNPTVFVVLVQKELSLADQRRMAWEEIYAHVASRDEMGNQGNDTHSLVKWERSSPISKLVVQIPEDKQQQQATVEAVDLGIFETKATIARMQATQAEIDRITEVTRKAFAVLQKGA